MSRHGSSSDGRNARSSAGSRWLRRLGVSLGIVRDPDAERIRTVTFGWLFGIGFAALGLARYVPGAGLFGESPFELLFFLSAATPEPFPERRLVRGSHKNEECRQVLGAHLARTLHVDNKKSCFALP